MLIIPVARLTLMIPAHPQMLKFLLVFMNILTHGFALIPALMISKATFNQFSLGGALSKGFKHFNLIRYVSYYGFNYNCNDSCTCNYEFLYYSSSFPTVCTLAANDGNTNSLYYYGEIIRLDEYTYQFGYWSCNDSHCNDCEWITSGYDFNQNPTGCSNDYTDYYYALEYEEWHPEDSASNLNFLVTRYYYDAGWFIFIISLLKKLIRLRWASSNGHSIYC